MLNMMNYAHGLSERDVLGEFLQALDALPQVRAQLSSLEDRFTSNQRFDAEVRLDVCGRTLSLLVEVKKSLYPRDVRELVWQVNRFGGPAGAAALGKEVVPLLAAESISPGAKELLRNENVGYFDTGGSLFLAADGLYFFIEKPPPRTLEKAVRSLFRGKRAQVIHTLLATPQEWYSVKEITELAEVSPATASETLSSLERFEWVESKGMGPSKRRRIVQPGALLDEWSKQSPSDLRRLEHRYYVPSKGTEEIMYSLTDFSDIYEAEIIVTREAAAQQYAPFLSSISQVVCRVRSRATAEDILGKLEARAVSEGANLIVIETPSANEFLFKQRVRGALVASPIQVYMDLRNGTGRASDMAGHLRRERIGF